MCQQTDTKADLSDRYRGINQGLRLHEMVKVVHEYCMLTKVTGLPFDLIITEYKKLCSAIKDAHLTPATLSKLYTLR